MGKNIVETLMGAIVLVVALGFVLIAFKSGNVDEVDGYMLSAKFDRVDGLSIGSDVRISGLSVGKIIDQMIDPLTYQAVVKFEVDDAIKIPKDSSAEIVSDGLLGTKYLALVPGGGEDMFSDGDEVEFTQSSISIESLIGKFMFGGSDDESKDTGAEDTTATDQDDIF